MQKDMDDLHETLYNYSKELTGERCLESTKKLVSPAGW